MKTIKRFLSMFLCVAVLVSAIPLSAIAVSETETTAGMLVNGTEIIDTGNCGDGNYDSLKDNLTYTLYENGLLVIDGTGEMSDFTLSYSSFIPYQPWSEYRDQITSVYISDGVTSIGDYAFWGCCNLSEIQLGDTITSLGSDAFSSTEYVSNSANWDNSILYIGNYLIDSNYSELPNKIIVKDGTKVIADRAFWDRDTLQTIVLPNSLKTIGVDVFSCADGLENIVFNGTVEEYCNVSFGSNLYFRSHNIYIDGSLATNVVIPEGVQNIQRAFDRCSSIVSVSIPSTVTNMGAAFNNCYSLKEVTIANGIKNVTGFTGCSSLKTISLPDSVETISGFSESGLQEITIGKGLKEVTGQTFHNCYNLEKVYYTGSVDDWCQISFSGFNCNGGRCSNPLYFGADLYIDNEKLTDVNIQEISPTLNANSFCGCSSIVNLKLNDQITKIGGGAFDGCASLERVILPFNLEIIGGESFYSCSNLKTITIADKVEEVQTNAFAYCNIENLIIADNSTTISKKMVVAWSSLKNVYIPNSVTEIANGAFSNRTSITDVYFAGSETEWNQINIGTSNECLTNATIHFNSSSPEEPVFIDVRYGVDRFAFGEDITGYVGDEIDSLVVYTSANENIASLDIKSSNTNIVEIGTIEIGVGDYITSENEHMATIPLKLKAEGTSTITITSPEGISESVTVTVEPVSYEIKMYSEIPTLVVGKDKTIGAALQLERNGTLVEDACQYSFAVSDSNVITISNVRNEDDGVYFYINGHKEGVVRLTVTETNTGAIYSALIQVNDGIITYNAEALPTYYDRDAECNGFVSGMYMDEFQSVQKNDTTLSVSFNVYNTTSLVGVVDVYDENNNLINSYPIKRYDGGIVSSLYETIKEGYYLIKDVVTGDILTYKQASYSQKTELKNIDVPMGGRIEITNDINYSDACCVLNVTELTITTILTVGDTIKGLSSSEIKKIAEESSLTILKNEIGAQLPEIASEFRKKIIKSISEDARDVIVADALNIASDNALNIFESFDIDFTKLVVDSAASLGVGIAEDAFVAATAFIGATLKGMFIVADYLELSCFIMQVAIPRSEKAMKIYFDDENGCLVSNGVSIKAENGTVDLSENNFVMHSIVLSNDDELTDMMKDSLDGLSNNYVVRNIYLERDGVISQPGQNVQVSVPVPNDYNIYECAIYWVKDDGSLEIMPTSITGDCLVFTTDHFSYYALVDLSTRSISGIITSFGDNNNVTLRLMEGLNEVKKIDSASGIYEFTGIAKGTYTLEVSKENHVTRTYEITVTDEDVVQDVKIHLLGDINGDGLLNIMDVNRANAHAKKRSTLTGYEFTCADINGDEAINIMDVNRMNAHAKKRALLW